LTIIVSVSQYINLLGPVPPNLYTGHLYSPFCQTKLEKDTAQWLILISLIKMTHYIYFKTASDKDKGSKIWDDKTN